MLILATPPLFGASLEGIPQNFWIKLSRNKLGKRGYLTVKIS